LGRTLLLARLALAVAAGALAGWASVEAAHLLSTRGVSEEGRGEAPPGTTIPLEKGAPPGGREKSDPTAPVSPERHIKLGARA